MDGFAKSEPAVSRYNPSQTILDNMHILLSTPDQTKLTSHSPPPRAVTHPLPPPHTHLIILMGALRQRQLTPARLVTLARLCTPIGPLQSQSEGAHVLAGPVVPGSHLTPLGSARDEHSTGILQRGQLQFWVYVLYVPGTEGEAMSETWRCPSSGSHRRNTCINARLRSDTRNGTSQLSGIIA